MKKLKTLNEQEMATEKKRYFKLLEYSFVNKEEDLLLDEDDDEPSPEDLVDQQGTDTSQTPELGAQPGQENMEPTPQPEIEATAQATAVPEPESNDVEIDVTQLTKDQSDISTKVDIMAKETNRTLEMLSALTDKLENVVQSTNSEMAKVKDEIIKRNPTSQEVLQKRLVVSDPFNQTPEQYWDKKQKDGHYKLEDDDQEKEYSIKNSDVDDINPMEIYKSFGLSDDEINQSLNKLFSY